MNRSSTSPILRAWLLACFTTAVVVAICWAWVDRPVADFAEYHFRHTVTMRWSEYLLKPMPVAAVVALLFLLVHTLRRAIGTPEAPWTLTASAASWAIAWAIALTEVLKRLVGRTDIYPAWVIYHLYTVYPIFWRPGADAFPSGTMLIGTALLAVLWRRLPAWRVLYAAVIVLLVFLLIVTSSHWVSDIIAGTFLGATVGWLTSVTQPGEPPVVEQA